MLLLSKAMERVFKSKVSIWLLCAISGFTIIPILPVFIYSFSWIAITIVALLLIFALYTLFDIAYIINNEILTVKCGIFPKQSYDINQISKITDTNSILASPAASLNRIAIYFLNQRNPLIISPKDKIGFIRYLQSLNPQIVYNHND